MADLVSSVGSARISQRIILALVWAALLWQTDGPQTDWHSRCIDRASIVLVVLL